eukprot:gnl/Spiro4/13443_TR7173_c0_g1_i1.p1 gnl/Spiro4/13443_TR7173_c0_g1~~gnl/Spiro4/13443_TR7173_c0_g1_i1.p1  ORF type:complete len:495 (+),score=134.14 gnl/Spiro4/13443_TR7173_c0_g1_i1:177-1487(+)
MDALLTKLMELDLQRVRDVFEEITKPRAVPVSAFRPPTVLKLAQSDPRFSELREQGLEMIAQGQVGVVTLAGGQGTRFSATAPKGTYDIGLPSRKSLFQLQAERLRRLEMLANEQSARLGRVANARVYWYLMTSDTTHTPTLQFFAAHNNFGLAAEQIMFFQQGMFPSLTLDGQLILNEDFTVFQNPHGNGSIFQSLANGPLEHMRAHGVRYVTVIAVDNVLVRPADPVFVAYCVAQQAETGTKVISKTAATEAVGVFAVRDGSLQVAEYSDITAEMRDSRDETGDLTFSAANICYHFFTVDFLQLAATDLYKQMMVHIARKPIKSVNADGTPCEVSGYKPELFIFDVFASRPAERQALFQVTRAEEFAPVKNATPDSPETCTRQLDVLHRSYITAAGGTLSSPDGVCEISPLVTYAGEGLEGRVSGRTVAPLDLV